MARPKRAGLDYFPLDVDFFDDEKISAINGEFGSKGEIIVIKLLCAIYRNGYFIQWNKLLSMKLLKGMMGVSPELLNQLVERLVAYEFFDGDLFNSAGVLTSRGIQRRYFEATRRREKADLLPYLLEDVYINRVSVYNNTPTSELMSSKSTQSKLNKSKENKIETISMEQGAVSAKEREMFLEIFFFKNFIDPIAEVDNFINHYTASGWRRKGDTKPVKDRVALASCWREDLKHTEAQRRFPQKWLDVWQGYYLEAQNNGEISASERLGLLTGARSIKEEQDRVIFTFTADLPQRLLPEVGKATGQVFPGKAIKGYLI